MRVNKIENSVTGWINVQSAVKDSLSSYESRKRKAGTLHSHVSVLDPEACMEKYGENGKSFSSEKNLQGLFFCAEPYITLPYFTKNEHHAHACVPLELALSISYTLSTQAEQSRL